MSQESSLPPLQFRVAPAAWHADMRLDSSPSRLAIVPGLEHDHVVVLKNKQLRHYRVFQDKVLPGVDITNKTPVMSAPLAVKNPLSGDGFDVLVLVLADKGGNRMLFRHQFSDNTWTSSEQPGMSDLIGEPCVTACHSSSTFKDGYFAAVVSATHLYVMGKSGDGKKNITFSMENPLLAAKNKLRNQTVSGLALGLRADPTKSDAFSIVIFLVSTAGLLEIALECDQGIITKTPPAVTTSPQSFRGLPGRLACLCGDAAIYQHAKDLVAAAPEGLVNYYTAGGSWQPETLVGEGAFGRPEIARFGPQLVVVARSGQKLCSFTSKPDYDKDCKREWTPLQVFGDAVTSDPVMFWRLSRQNRQRRLVVAVEVAAAGVQYFWFDGTRWITGQP